MKALFRPLARLFAGGATLLALSAAAQAAETNVAVAANFTDAAKEIGKVFEEKTGHKVVFSFGSTGQLFAQITQDAPFTVFLSADDETPKKAIDQGFAVPGSAFTYSVGKLVLWSVSPTVTAGEEALRAGKFEKIALANPKTAPYGAAAVQVMMKMGVYDALKARIVQGNNIAQTYQFVETGNAELGFIALSQVIRKPVGSRWMVPSQFHDPIRQDAVLLKKGEKDDAAKAFLEFLKGPEAAKVMESYGYGAGAAG